MLGMSEPKKTKRQPRQIVNNELFSISRAATYKGVSTRAVYQRINAGLLPFISPGEERSMKLVYKSDLDAWEVARERQQQDRQPKDKPE